MNWQLMFKGNYISAVEFDGKKPTWAIASVSVLPIEGDDGTMKQKCVIKFQGMDRGWIPCRTNAICLARMFGDDTNDWIGKRITLFSTEVQFGKKKVPGIRVLGSPEIAAPMQVEIKLPRKKPLWMTMQKTTPGAAAKPGAAPATQKAAPQVPPAEPKPADVHHFDKPATNPMHDPAAEPPDEAFDTQTGELTM